MDTQAIARDAEQIARHAGEILQQHFASPRQHLHKGNVDLVTEADTEAEAYIVDALKSAYPDWTIVGEEGSDYRPGKGGSDYYWYIDPLDGTTNFAHRLPHFAVSMSLAGIDSRPVVGVIYDPIRDECFTAVEGGGATLNGENIQVTAIEKLIDALVGTGFPYDRHTSPDNNLKQFNAMLKRAQGVRRIGAAALDLAYVAAGRLDGYWEMKLNLWDCLAGILLVQEAGGRVTDYHRSDQHVYQKRPEVLATNGKIHEEMSVVLVTAH